MFQKVDAWFSSKGGYAHVMAMCWMLLCGAYYAVPEFKELVLQVYNAMPAWSHTLLAAGSGLLVWYKNTQRKSPFSESIAAQAAKGVGVGLLIVALSGMMVFSTGCAVKNQTPQYNAAIGINDFTHALTAFQNIEIDAHDAGFIAEDLHKEAERAIKKGFQYDALAETAAKAGDLTTSQSYYAAALAALKDLQPNLVGVKNPNSQAALKAALSGVIAIAQDWAGGATH